MLSLGAFSFAAPWALAALAVLPAIWWLLRITPPAPWHERFPPVRLLLGLVSPEDSAARSPLWLLVLRLTLAAAVIVAVARPVINAGTVLRGTGPLIAVIDDGWAAARDWSARQETLAALLDEAERQGRAVALATTAPGDAAAAAGSFRMMRPAEARRAIEALRPKPWATKRAAAIAALAGDKVLSAQQPGHVVWLSDGLEDGDTMEAARSLRRLGALTVYGDAAERPAVVLRPPLGDGEALTVTALRAQAPAAASQWVSAIGEDGALLARQALRFEAGKQRAEARLLLPAELRNRLVRLELEGIGTAGTVVLIDERWRRRLVGLYAGAGALAEQPLLGQLYYLERALLPFTEVRRGAVAELLRRQLSVLVLADPGRLEPGERRQLKQWIAAGGVVVRFAGPRLSQELAEGSDMLLPVDLREGDRAMGGVMSWSKPAALAPFPEGGPFHGLEVPRGISVHSQVLARPALDLAEKTWAELSDGTPLVTGERRGRGWLVLVHTTANTGWSNLALSGLFVEMLRRLVELGEGVPANAAAGPLPPIEVLDGFGRLGPPAAGALGIPGGKFGTTTAGPRHPPGYYGGEGVRRALNLSAGLPEPKPLGALPPGTTRLTYGGARETDLMPWFLVAALVLALADFAASLALRRLLGFSAAALATLAVLAPTGDARAQTTDDAAALASSLQTRLAFVITGSPRVDETSRAGLQGLSVIVNRRTAAELGAPVGVDPAVDELVFFPLLYWPVTADQPPPVARAITSLNDYLRNGGTIVFDTRDGGNGAGATGAAALRGLGRELEIPPLEAMAADHVLGRAYYLMNEFPGRWRGHPLWVERPGERINDGVSSVIVGAHDWAAAWAMDELQRPLFAVVPGGERQREWAYRFGINLVMYTLTGNYKADQVHLPAILRRLGQ